MGHQVVDDAAAPVIASPHGRVATRSLRRGGLLAAVALALLGCGQPAASAGGVPLFTGEITAMGGACFADVSAHKSVLSRDPMDGTAMFDGARLVPVMWPVGYTARLAGEQVEVLDKQGQVVATTGRIYRLVGRYHAGTFQTCMTDPPEEVKG